MPGLIDFAFEFVELRNTIFDEIATTATALEQTSTSDDPPASAAQQHDLAGLVTAAKTPDFPGLRRFSAALASSVPVVPRCGPPHPSGHTGSLPPDGVLSPRIVQAIIRAKFPRMRRCYEDALERHPDLKGRVQTQLAIMPDGTVAKVKDVDSPIADAVMATCVRDVFAGLRFPKHTTRPITIVYPIAFDPAD